MKTVPITELRQRVADVIAEVASEVREAEAEYQAGQAKPFEDMEQLLDELRT